MIRFTGPLKVWHSDEGRMHFMTVPEDLAGEIRVHSLIERRGFGSVRVEVTVGEFTWRTSLFPSKSTGSYFLPVKIEVLRRTGIGAGDDVGVNLELL